MWESRGTVGYESGGHEGVAQRGQELERLRGEKVGAGGETHTRKALEQEGVK